MKFKSYHLDPFQVKAIKAIQHGQSVIVSAATGTGKTLIAEYIIHNNIKNLEGKVIYTAPIKALSNQKFKDFSYEYGEEYIGMLTGDVVINPSARILIMTTEIYRNMLLTRDPCIQDVTYVIFDEIHFMNDPERGTVWEESILFSSSDTPFLCLSATIPNANEFRSWLQSLKNHPVVTVFCEKRYVPLHHFIYTYHHGLLERNRVKPMNFKRNKRKKKGQVQMIHPSKIIKQLQGKFPVLLFSFSRKQCEDEAEYLARVHSFIAEKGQKEEIREICFKKLSSEIIRLPSTKKLIKTLEQGIGFHHAGLLPQQRFLVEELFSKGILPVLFATETFSVGINMPAKTVIIYGMKKFDGVRFRFITSKEYFQLAGRAGRRGIDKEGFVIAIPDPSVKIKDVLVVSEKDTQPILSQFQLSFNTILNMLDTFNDEEINLLLHKNFYVFQQKYEKKKAVRMKTSFTKKCNQLQMMKYLTKQNVLTPKGEFTKHIYFNEILIGELFATDLYWKLSDLELIQIIAGIIYERRPNDHFSFKGIEQDYKNLMEKLSQNRHFFKKLHKLSLKRMMALTKSWVQGDSFESLLELTTYREGDIVRLFRRIIDMLQQIQRATDNEDLVNRLKICQEIIDRDLVAVDIY
jgi:superfamily II RNA helicase